MVDVDSALKTFGTGGQYPAPPPKTDMRYSNPWSGKQQFYKGKRKKLPTAETDKEYKAYCKRKQNKDKVLSYKAWCAKERRLHGMF